MLMMQALHEGKMLNFGHLALEHMLHTGKKDGKYLPYLVHLQKYVTSTNLRWKMELLEVMEMFIIPYHSL